jgi:ABC-2 type transport system permease protein
VSGGAASPGRSPVPGWPAPAPSPPPIPRRPSEPVLGASVLGPLLGLTIRGLLGRRRILLVSLLALAPVGVAVVLVVGGGLGTSVQLTREIYEALVMTTIVPLVALILGTTAIGAEIDDGTIVHLLAKPVGRGWIVLAKMLVAGTAGAILCGTSVLVSSLLLVRLDMPGLVLGMLAGVVVAVITYAAVFVTLSVWTGRALIAGLAYVLLWEGFIASFFSGTRLLSVREYGLAVAAYRRALALHEEDVSTRVERGVAAVMAGRPHDAVAVWNGIPLDDHRVVQARRQIRIIRGER